MNGTDNSDTCIII